MLPFLIHKINNIDKIIQGKKLYTDGIDETEENSDSVNEEVQYVDIISLGNLIIHQSQIDGAKQENSYDFSPSFQYIKKMILDSEVLLN